MFKKIILVLIPITFTIYAWIFTNNVITQVEEYKQGWINKLKPMDIIIGNSQYSLSYVSYDGNFGRLANGDLIRFEDMSTILHGQVGYFLNNKYVEIKGKYGVPEIYNIETEQWFYPKEVEVLPNWKETLLLDLENGAEALIFNIGQKVAVLYNNNENTNQNYYFSIKLISPEIKELVEAGFLSNNFGQNRCPSSFCISPNGEYTLDHDILVNSRGERLQIPTTNYELLEKWHHWERVYVVGFSSDSKYLYANVGGGSIYNDAIVPGDHFYSLPSYIVRIPIASLSIIE